jgi:hypothetical protein
MPMMPYDWAGAAGAISGAIDTDAIMVAGNETALELMMAMLLEVKLELLMAKPFVVPWILMPLELKLELLEALEL